MSLTDLEIKKLRPKKNRYDVDDGQGLFLRITPQGKKSWCSRYTIDGVRKRMTIGRYPALSLADAREKHTAALNEAQRGNDPAAKKREAEAARRAAPTFSDLWLEFLEKELQDRPATADRKRMIEKDVLPAWATRKVSTITRRDGVLLLDEVKKRAPVGANRLQGVLVRMFYFAAERGILEHSPLAGMRRGKEKSRERVLTNDEIKTLWGCLDLERTDVDIYRVTKLALKAILLTGQRPGEVAGMRWDEIDGDVWVIPKERSKNGEENRVPILPILKAVLDEAKVYSSDSAFVFRSSRSDDDNDRSVTVGALANAIRRHRTEIKISERFTPHDLRRTVRTRLAEIGVSDIVAEKVLGHKLGGIMAVYNRHGYDVEKRHALDRWEQRLQGIVGLSAPASNVIPFEVRHA